jgi:hypothetical protein
MVINEALMCLAAYIYAAVSKYVSRVKRSCCKNNHSLSQSVAQGEKKVQKKCTSADVALNKKHAVRCVKLKKIF